MEPNWQEITKGSNWKHRKTGRLCIVQRAPTYRSDVVELLHQSGRISAKQVHYFLYDFEKVKPSNSGLIDK